MLHVRQHLIKSFDPDQLLHLRQQQKLLQITDILHVFFTQVF